jgi:hypothetical protein
VRIHYPLYRHVGTLCVLLVLNTPFTSASAAAEHPAAIDSNRSASAFGIGEAIRYDLRWQFIKGGEAEMSVLADATTDTLLQIRSRAWSTGFVDYFYTVRDTIHSIIDRHTLWPVKFVKRQHEGSYHRDSTYVFDQQSRTISRNGESFACSVQVHDILSVLYRVRTYPLAVGQSFEATVYEGGRLYTARINVLRRETIEVPAGTFDCIVAEPILKSDAVFRQKGRLWIWFTNDERHIPVRMTSKIPIGEIRAEMTSYVPSLDGSESW